MRSAEYAEPIHFFLDGIAFPVPNLETRSRSHDVLKVTDAGQAIVSDHRHVTTPQQIENSPQGHPALVKDKRRTLSSENLQGICGFCQFSNCPSAFVSIRFTVCRRAHSPSPPGLKFAGSPAQAPPCGGATLSKVQSMPANRPALDGCMPCPWCESSAATASATPQGANSKSTAPRFPDHRTPHPSPHHTLPSRDACR
jgi:hypothetical protein